jgi:Ig domain of plant-specific actin-binding protein
MQQARPSKRSRFLLPGLVAALGTVMAALAGLSGSSVAAPQVAPVNTEEPSISGSARVGNVLRGDRGEWTGGVDSFTQRWMRCDPDGSAPDASDCAPIQDATGTNYRVRSADRGFRLRFRVTATNEDGSTTVASDQTARVSPTVGAGAPQNTRRPSISGTPAPGNRLQADRGDWSGEEPMTFAFQWLRCDAQGNECGSISGANRSQHDVQSADVGRTLRVRVTARNDDGRNQATSAQTPLVQQQAEPPASSSVAVESLRAAGDRLVVSQVQFSPNPVTSRTSPITVRVRVTNRDTRAVRGAMVFMRATPRVVQGQTQATANDGWVTLTLVPNQLFPQPRSGRNVQFFIKAFRRGDPGLGGIAGYRLVQVRLAG